MVPHLITALTGPINELEQRILDTTPAIERWFRLEWMEHTPPFYCAVDVRNAGFKLAPVDTNLFPDGWNNLSADMLPLAVQAGMAAIEKICPEARNLLIVPEAQARNSFYNANLLQLQRIFRQAGLNVRFGSVDPALKAPIEQRLPMGETLVIEPLQRVGNRLCLKDFDPCTVLLNSDLSAGIPGILEEVNEQYLLPPLHGSWPVRRKSGHFRAYEEVAKRFGKLLGIDPWLINPMFQVCGEEMDMDITGSAGLAALAPQVDMLLAKIRRKYKEYGISEKPFVVVKANNGTSGRGIMTVRDAKDLETPGRMGHGKGHGPSGPKGQAESEVLIQEGVLTQERVNDAWAEPVVYTMDRYVVGGFYRVHGGRGMDENLNAPGANYVPLAFAESGRLAQPGAKPGFSNPNRFYMYGVIARLAMLAASYELEATNPEAEVYD